MKYVGVVFLALFFVTACEHMPSLPSGTEFGFSFKLPNGKAPTHAEAEALRSEIEPVLINGDPVDKNQYPHIIRIFVGSSSCTASVVGKRAILTAAHCGETGETAKFTTVSGKQYQAKLTRAPIYPEKDLDLSLGLVSQDIDVKPISVRIDRFEKKGMVLDFWGYGCTKPGGGGGNDGILRAGKSKIQAGQEYDLVCKTDDGSALCYGDSGGPVTYEGKQIAVNSKGNIEDVSYVTRTTLPDAADFFKSWSEKTGAKICGVNAQCDGSESPPPGEKTFKFENDFVTIEGKVK